MRRLKNKLTLAIILSAVLADLTIFTPSFAYSNEALELNRKGLAAIESGRYADAIPLLKQAMSLEPTWGEPCYNAARLLGIGGKREEMLKMLRKANGVEPDNELYETKYLEALYEELDKAEKEANSEAIEKHKNEILRVNPGNFKLGLKKLKEHVALKEDDAAFELAKDLLEKNSKFRSKYKVKEMGELNFYAAQYCFEKGDLNSAKSYADNARKFEFEQNKEAEQLLSQIRKTIVEKVNDLIEKSDAARQKENFSKAREYLKEAEKYDNDNETIKNGLVGIDEEEEISKTVSKAKSLIASDKWLDAREVLLKTKEKYPESGKILDILSEIKSKETDLCRKIGLPNIPVVLEDRKKALENIINSGVELLEKENYTLANEQFRNSLTFVDADKSLESYRSKIESHISKIDKFDKDHEYWTKALDARNAGEYEDVLKYLKKLPANYDIQMDSYLAEAYYKTGDIEKATHHGSLQLSKQKENNRAKFVLGCIALDADELGRAHLYFKEIYESDPEYPEIGDKLALSSKKYLPTVIGAVILILLIWIFISLKKNLPIYNKNSLIRKAKGCFNHQDWDGCLEIIQKVKHSAYLTNADTFEIAKYSAQSYLKKGRYDLAIGECKHLITLSPKSEDAHLWLGYAYLGRRMLSPDALPELLNLYKKESRNIALVSLLGSYYAQQKNLTEDGVAILEQWLNLDYDNVEVLKPLGKYYLRKNRSDDKAMKVFVKMMEIGSPDPDFMLGVANAYLKSRDFDKCLDLCQRVIETDPNNSLVHSVLLDAYKLMNRLPELLDIYANTLKEFPYNVAFQKGLLEAQAAYEKFQARNARQAAAEAAAVMGKMNLEPDSSFEEADSMVAPGQIACPACGKGNAEGAYCCQHCGANMFQ